jgi:hypothetical protein
MFRAITGAPPHVLFAVGSQETPTFRRIAARAERGTAG